MKKQKLFHLSTRKWEAISVHLPPEPVNTKGGRPRISNKRCFEGILWTLRTGAQWQELPKDYGSGTTCWRRLKEWEADGTLMKMWRAFLKTLNDSEHIQWDQCFVDGSFAPAKKGGLQSEKPRKARVQSGWYWSMAKVFLWEFPLPRRLLRKSGLLKA